MTDTNKQLIFFLIYMTMLLKTHFYASLRLLHISNVYATGK